LVGLDAAGTADAWAAAGFAVVDGTVTIGAVRIAIGVGHRGVAAWTLAGIPDTDEVDGLPTRVVSDGAVSERAGTGVLPVHPNGATLIDHLVIFSPDDERTIGALVGLGFDVRRVRDDARPGLRQTFLRAGEVILELVTRADTAPPAEPQPAQFFGIACTVSDIDACASSLGDALGDIKDAVQPGRRIATLHGRAIGLDVPIAFMSAEPRQAARA
jgi:hypothetical protein